MGAIRSSSHLDRQATASSSCSDTTRAARFNPYYTLLDWPGDSTPQFSLVRPFVPFSETDERKNLTSIMAAHKARHFYATEDPNLQLVFATSDDSHIMGDIFETKERPTFAIKAIGTAPVAKVSIVRSGKYIHVAEPNQGEVAFEFDGQVRALLPLYETEVRGVPMLQRMANQLFV